MLDRLTRRLYERLGRRYILIFPVSEIPAALVIAAISVPLLVSFYGPSFGQVMVILAVVSVATIAAMAFALYRGHPYIERVAAWQQAEQPSTEEAVAAWDGATNFPMRSFRANSLRVATIAALPTTVFVTLYLQLTWTAAPVIAVATLLPIAYATAVNYAMAELLMRPVIDDIAATLPDDFPFKANGLLIRKRLKLLLPIFTAFVGFVVAALMTGDGGTKTLAESVAAAVGIGLLFSFELTVLLARSVTGPIATLRKGLAQVQAGDYDARVPVLTSDELGELSHDFNLMAQGLAEREHMRDAFGTYLDRDIVPLILSGRFPQEGVEVTVSMMFVDVRGFTSFAERAEATEVVAALNSLFEVMVPIVREHGGHVDKFMGDGMMVVFGAPEGYADHADRAVEAGIDLVHTVNRPGAQLEIAVGVNTGSVIAGSIGGAGRLNFSVIGDAVNVAARVEAATRATGDDMLITVATRDAMTRPIELRSRGTVPLKGKSEPIEVLACTPATLAAESAGPADSVRAHRAVRG